MIHDVKNDSILQVSSQEPLMSSKYDFKDVGFWHTSNHCRELKFDTEVKYHI